MSEKVKLKKEYVKLIQKGEKDEAFKVLKKVWNFNKEKPEKEEVVVKLEKILVKKKKSTNVKKPKFAKIKDLSKIKGIGKETMKDISSIYPSIKDLIEDIKSNKSLPLRNDIEYKLRKQLI